MPKYKAVIFDLDGTLLDTLDDLMDALNHTMQKFGFPDRTRAETRKFVGNGVDRLIELAIPDGRNNPHYADAVREYRTFYAAHSELKTKPYDGVCELIRKLISERIGTAVVSNKIHEATVTLCKKYFPDIKNVCGERESEGIRRKPYPDTVFSVVKSLGFEPSECVYVGDSEVDILTAENAGMDCISVLWGFRDQDYLIEQGGKIFAANADELYNIINCKTSD